jgi:hypothetical protein
MAVQRERTTESGHSGAPILYLTWDSNVAGVSTGGSAQLGVTRDDVQAGDEPGDGAGTRETDPAG